MNEQIVDLMSMVAKNSSTYKRANLVLIPEGYGGESVQLQLVVHEVYVTHDVEGRIRITLDASPIELEKKEKYYEYSYANETPLKIEFPDRDVDPRIKEWKQMIMKLDEGPTRDDNDFSCIGYTFEEAMVHVCDDDSLDEKEFPILSRFKELPLFFSYSNQKGFITGA